MRQAENAVEHAGLLEAVDQAADGIVLTDIHGNIQFVNSAFSAMTGYSREEVLGRNLRLLKSGRMSGDFYENLWRTVLSGKVWQGDVINRRKNGTLCEEEMRVAPVRDANGKTIGYIATQRDLTERRQAEKKRREREERFREVFEGAPLGIALSGLEGNFILANALFCRMLGYSKEQMEAISWRQVTVPEDIPESATILQRLFQQPGETAGVDKRYIRSDGTVVWAHSKISLITDAQGTPLHFVVMVEGIDARKQAQQALQSSEEKFRQLAENIHEAFWMISPAGTEILYVSPAYEQIWGRTCASLYASPMNWMEAIHPDDRAHAHDTFMKQLKGESVDSEFRIHTPDGQEKWIRDRAFPVRDQDGQLVKIAGVAEEITERKRDEVVLRQTTDRLTLAARAGGVGIWDNDVVKKTLEWDDQMFRLYGVTKDEFGGTYEAWLAGLHPEDRQRVHEQFEAALRGEKEFDGDFRVVWPDGSVHHIRVLALVERDASGNAIHMIGTNWDITDQKLAAEALQISNRHLEEETLRANQFALKSEKATAAKSEFLANMSHEIRTPMNGVIGMAQLLLETELTPDQRHFTEAICACGNSLLTIINQILDLSKIEARRLELEMEDFDLDQLLHNLLASFAPQAYEKRIELVCFPDPGIPYQLRGDSGRLQQILSNLIGNAIKFTEKGEVAIRVTAERMADSDCLLRVSVRDTGIGIPEDKLGILFEKFSQVEVSTTRKFGGTGLGLAISKQLAEMMGGSIGATSREGEGSEFWFTARLGSGLGADPDEAEKNAQNRANLQGIHLLIVDDNATSREVLSAMTTSWGMRTVATENGAEALAALHDARGKNDPFAIAVIDMQMPGMDGESLGRAIRSDQSLSGTLMVMLRSFSPRPSFETPERIGFSGCAYKPIRGNDLCQTLNKVLFNLADVPSIAEGPTQISAPPFAGLNVKVLLAEDNATNREVALGMLKKLGIRADSVGDGAEAVAALEAIPYDLVLMDVRMPVMNGIDATRQIRDPHSAVLNHDVPIVAMTANAMKNKKESCFAAGMNDFVSKPASMAVLQNVLKKWLRIEGIGASAQAGQLAPHQPAESTPKVFDFEGVTARLEGDSALAQIVFASFLEDCPRQIQVLKSLAESGDLDGSARLAHSIKGASASVGGQFLQRLAAEMETAAGAGDLCFITKRMNDLEFQFNLLKKAINQNEPVYRA